MVGEIDSKFQTGAKSCLRRHNARRRLGCPIELSKKRHDEFSYANASDLGVTLSVQPTGIFTLRPF